MITLAGEEEAFINQLKDDLGNFVNKLPPEVRAEAQDELLRSAIDGNATLLLSHVSSYLAGRVTGEGR